MSTLTESDSPVYLLLDRHEHIHEFAVDPQPTIMQYVDTGLVATPPFSQFDEIRPIIPGYQGASWRDRIMMISRF